MTPIAPHVQVFFRERLPVERGVSQNTIDSYSTAFQLLFEFASKRLKIPPSELQLEQIDARLVTAFLAHLETARGNSPASRNVRLAAIKSFMRFVEHRVPSALEQIRQILAIPPKKTEERPPVYLSLEEMEVIINTPEPTTRYGIRDRAMLCLGFENGLRVYELIGLRVDDVNLEGTPSVHVRGKGRRERTMTLDGNSAKAIRAWLAVRGEAGAPELFLNARATQMTRSGFEYILHKHVTAAAKRCPSLLKKRISPHTLRHTCAMTTLQATGDIRKVALWLGHAHTNTTDRYTRIDPALKLAAVKTGTLLKLRPGRFRPTDKLMALLKQASLCGAQNAREPCSRRRERSDRA